jgi:regulator of cell morphogenesis and NO signaling
MKEILNTEVSEDEINALELCNYLMDKQHYYEHEQLLGIHVHLSSAAKIDGDHFPVVEELSRIFEEFKGEFENHMRKERQLIYPFLYENGKTKDDVKKLLLKEIVHLKKDHEKFKEKLDRMRVLSAGYTPEMSCSPTCKLSMIELKELDTDLKKLMRMEEKILFPMLE